LAAAAAAVHTMNALLRPRAPFETLEFGAYDLLMIDPPWPNANRSPKGERKSSVAKYGAMSWREIAALPIADLMSRDCVVLLWCTWGLLFDGGDAKRHYEGHDPARSRPGECVKAWTAAAQSRSQQLRYVTGGPWLKRTKTGKLAFGTCYRLAGCNEPFLLYVRGAPKTERGIRNVIDGLRREHSRKPEEAFAFCEKLMPDGRKLELFSRCNHPGWDTWGYEAGKFDPVVHKTRVPLDKRRVSVHFGTAVPA
jgi:N6-adenosine-specific RNA methylase IME4